MRLVTTYLLAITLANLVTAEFGPVFVVPVVFLLIGLDLTVRDVLHERWRGRHLWLRMATLIAAGSGLSALVNLEALPIAVASFGAFASAGLTDTVIYAYFRHEPREVRMAYSNAVSALVDSVVFQALAFGLPLALSLLAGQYAAKVLGGAFWIAVFRVINRRDRREKRNGQ